tara:strand:- start:3220 stop:4164 length:945 start_codon:yes stop_codon:yes gene_type:complete
LHAKQDCGTIKKATGESPINLLKKMNETKESIETLTEISKNQAVGYYNITPEFAQEILDEYNEQNRDMRPCSIKTRTLVLDMEDGNFFPSLIKFDKNGSLIDGQHRLYAVTKQNRPVTFIVETGADSESIFMTDIGNPRSWADRFTLAVFKEWGLPKSYRSRAASISMFWQDWCDGKSSTNSGAIYSFAERLKFLTDNKDSILFAAKFLPNDENGRLFKRKAFSMPLAMLHSIDPVKAQEFAFEAVNGYDLKGEKLKRSNPAYYVHSLITTTSVQDWQDTKWQARRVLLAMQYFLNGKNIRKDAKVESVTQLKG